ncbi:MAG TPA: MCP four helix bundle domain-containing protein [Pedobacter sp.]|uniref:MCP four helix bundle domain-containing protein n=1 Tax=Pedobacter sp. TaxID=1411316 RepID=UPI002BD36F94|nr:MCP four helix bundle domain-containing protein [Pedobacter sp.]HMI01237.1 MCP four helix bundle domain-containing protein [Pedobacter sp.]
MRLAFSVKQKIRIAALLFAVMTCSILIRFLEDQSVKSMNESFVSMYNDRLIPATDLFYIAEKANAKKSLLEEALYSSQQQIEDQTVLTEKLKGFNTAIDSLIRKYKKTLLVKQEKAKLNELDKRLFNNVQAENSILQLLKARDLASARKLYENTGRASADLSIQKLSELMAIQKQVGQELIKDSAFMVSGSKLYSALQIALAIVIGILIVGIIFTSNVVKINNDKFNLN